MVDIDFVLMKLRHVRPEDKLLDVEKIERFLSPEEFKFVYEVVEKYGKKHLAGKT